jgi:hypothetical protein
MSSGGSTQRESMQAVPAALFGTHLTAGPVSVDQT